MVPPRREDGLRDALIATQPDVFFTTPHYDGHPYVLVRLAAAEPDQIGGLIARAHAQAAPAKRRRVTPAAGLSRRPAPRGTEYRGCPARALRRPALLTRARPTAF